MGGRTQIFWKMAVSPAFSSYSFGGSIYDDVYSFRTLGKPAYHGPSPWPLGAVQLMLEHNQKQESRVLDHLSESFFMSRESPLCPSWVLSPYDLGKFKIQAIARAQWTKEPGLGIEDTVCV